MHCLAYFLINSIGCFSFGFPVFVIDHFGGQSFRVERSQKRKKINRFNLWIVERVVIRLSKFMKSDSESYSTYAGIIARRIKTK